MFNTPVGGAGGAHFNPTTTGGQVAPNITASGQLRLLPPDHLRPAVRPAGLPPNQARASLEGLHSEVLEIVVEMLPGPDVIALGQTGSAIRNALKDHVDSAISTSQAARVRTLSEFRAVRLKIDGFTRLSLRQKPLEALAGAIRFLPERERRAAFGEVRDAVAALPEQHRAQPLAALARAIRFLPERERRAAFDEVRDAVAALPEQHRAQPLAALAGAIRLLSERVRLAPTLPEHTALMGGLPAALSQPYRSHINRFLCHLEQQDSSWSDLVPDGNGVRPAALEQAVNAGMRDHGLHIATRAALNRAFGLSLQTELS